MERLTYNMQKKKKLQRLYQTTNCAYNINTAAIFDHVFIEKLVVSILP